MIAVSATVQSFRRARRSEQSAVQSDRQCELSANSRISLLTVSARPQSAVFADAGGAKNRAILYARPVTLKILIEN